MDLLELIWIMSKISGNSVMKINRNSWARKVGNASKLKEILSFKRKTFETTAVILVVVGVGVDRGGGGVVIVGMTLSFSGWSGILI
jgi:hypothetical protein